MEWTFSVNYKSGRTEEIKAYGPARANEIRTDLIRMQQGGAVSSYSVATKETKAGEARKPLTSYLKATTINQIAESAAQNGRSVSAEIAQRLGDAAE